MPRQKLDSLLDEEEFTPDPPGKMPGNGPESDVGDPTGTAGATRPAQSRSARTSGAGLRKPPPAAVVTSLNARQIIKNVVLSQRAAGKKTSIGAEALRMVERQQPALATAWNRPADEPSGGGLFGLHAEASDLEDKVHWQLHGVSPQQIDVLDTLSKKHQAPSRSAYLQKAIELDDGNENHSARHTKKPRQVR